MGKCRNKANDCNCGNRHETCCGNQSPCESLKKYCSHDGWTFRWTSPEQQSLVRSIIPGPFLRPKLLHAFPYALASNCRDCTRQRSNRAKPRNGIPDPWLEYLAWKEKRFPKDPRFCWEYMWLTDYVWNSRGLAMLQGIPDPWRVDLNCSCFDVEKVKETRRKPRRSKDEDVDVGEVEETRKKSRRSKDGDVYVGEVEETRKKSRRSKDGDGRERVSRDLPKRDSKGKDDEKVKEEEKKKERNGYERVKDRMTELEDELRSKDAEKKRIWRYPDKAAGSKRTSKCKTDVAKKVIDSEKPAKKISKDSGGKAPRVSFDGVNDRIMRCNDDITKIREDAKLARDKIRKLKEKKEASSRRKSSLCAGNCGRLLPKERVLKSIKLNDEATSSSLESAREFLREINERIAITKDALKSPELQRRERGAGDNANEVIDLRQHSLFARSGITIDRRIPDRSDCGRSDLRESELLIVETFSEQDI